MTEQTETNQQTNSQRPAARFTGSGGLQVAVWKHKQEDGPDNYSVRVDRSYKDKQDEYQSTPYLRDGDLLRVNQLLSKADDWIEQDKGRRLTQASGQAR